MHLDLLKKNKILSLRRIIQPEIMNNAKVSKDGVYRAVIPVRLFLSLLPFQEALLKKYISAAATRCSR
jgi:hypothetical protein